MPMKTLALAAALCLIPSLAFSQAPPSANPASARVVRVGEIIRVDVSVPRPWSWIFARSAPRYTPPEMPHSFTPPVVQAVRRNPF